MQRKRFDKIQNPFIVKKFSEGNILSQIKKLYKYPTANIILNGARLNAFP